MRRAACGFFRSRKENIMKYNITLTRDELSVIILGLDSGYHDCCEHCDPLNGFDDEAELEKLNEVMEVGKLLQRFLDIYNHAE